MWRCDCLLPAANQCDQFPGYRFSGALDYNSKNVKTNPTVTRYAGTEDVWRFCKGQMITILFQCERYKKNHDHSFQFSFNASNVVDDDGFKFKDDNYWSDSSVDQYDLPPSRDFRFLSRGRLPKLSPYQQTQVIMMTMTMLTRQSLKTSLASIASSPPTIATLSILKARTKGDHFTPVLNPHQFNM